MKYTVKREVREVDDESDYIVTNEYEPTYEQKPIIDYIDTSSRTRTNTKRYLSEASLEAAKQINFPSNNTTKRIEDGEKSNNACA